MSHIAKMKKLLQTWTDWLNPLGVDRSGLIRQTMRARVKTEADSAKLH